MPDIQLLLARYQRRFQLAAIASAAIVAAAAGGLTAGAASVSGMPHLAVQTLAGGAAALIGPIAAWFWWRQWTLARVAAAIEARVPLDNLAVTAEQTVSGRGQPLHPIVQAELVRQAVDRLQQASPVAIRPLAKLFALAGGALVAFAAVLWSIPTIAPGTTAATTTSPESAAPLAAGDIRITVIPPSYTQRPIATAINPTSIVAIEGSRVRFEARSDGTPIRLVDTDLKVTPFQTTGDRLVHEFTATTSRAIVMQYADSPSSSDRLVHLRVDSDRRPVVRIRQPAKDLMFGAPAGQVPIEVDARDDLGLKSVALRYTRVAGSGETFTFEEGELPVQIVRGTRGTRGGNSADSEGESWTARATLALEALKLQDGDTLVYRALAADFKPGADPSISDTFVIEIGRLAGVASTGFALPDDRQRQAISQQMLIIKTERLHAERGKVPAEAFAEQARMLAIEQRMVKAEFVFMTGGEVADEVEEAEHSHELAEGRLENAGQVELLAAIREMSRAEARLNDADTTRGLEFERAALKALQRAFDRRRYLLRTLPERARIDVTRRLTGELAAARSSTQTSAPVVQDAMAVRARDALRAVSVWTHGGDEPSSRVASRIIAVDPSSDALQKGALQLSSVRDADERRRVAQAVQAMLVDVIRSRAFAGGAGRVAQPPLHGRVADELSRAGAPR